MTDEKNDKPDAHRGFKALGSLSSDLSKLNTEQPTTPFPNRANDPPDAPNVNRPSPASVDKGSPAPSRSSPTRWAGFVWGGLIVAVILIASYVSKDSSRPASPTAATTTNYIPPPQQSQPLVYKLEAKVPQAGKDLILNVSEIFWCRREKIRIDTFEARVNTYKSADVSRFNSKVDYYNARCSNYRYKRSDLERADAEVMKERASIISQANLEWDRGY